MGCRYSTSNHASRSKEVNDASIKNRRRILLKVDRSLVEKDCYSKHVDIKRGSTTSIGLKIPFT